MFSPFELKKPVGLAYSHDLDDVFKTKKALDDLGHFETPKYGATRYPDMPMFDAIKSFQKSRGLAVDGVMKPDGPTAFELGRVLAERSLRSRPIVDAAPRAAVSPLKDSVGAPLPSRPGADPRPKLPKTGDKLALGPAAAVLPLVLGAAGRAALHRVLQATAGGIATAATGALKGDTPTGDQTKIPPLAKRTDIATPPPPTPLSEPQDGPGPTKTEFPAKPPFKPIDLSRPIPETQEPTIFVHPLPPEELTGPQIIVRKGNEETRKELEGIRDYFEERGWEHTAGGRYSAKHSKVLKGKRKVGDEQEEYYIQGPGKGRQGANYSDLTFRTKDGRTIHVQSVDVDKNGKPTQWELDAAERIRRATKNTDIILIPKGAQLNKIFKGRN